MLNGDVSVSASKVQVERSAHLDLTVVLHAFELVEFGVLGQRGSLVVEVLGRLIGSLDLVLDAQNQVTILDHDVRLGRVDVGRQTDGHGDVLGAVRVVDDAREEVRVGTRDGLAERHLDDQVAVLGHEAHHLVGLGVLRQLERLADLTTRVVLRALDDVLLLAEHDELMADDFGLDRLGRETGHVDADAVLLRHLGHQRLEEMLGSAEPVEVAADHVVELVERVEEIESGHALRMRVDPLVHVEHGSREHTMRKQSHFGFSKVVFLEFF